MCDFVPMFAVHMQPVSASVTRSLTALILAVFALQRPDAMDLLIQSAHVSFGKVERESLQNSRLKGQS